MPSSSQSQRRVLQFIFLTGLCLSLKGEPLEVKLEGRQGNDTTPAAGGAGPPGPAANSSGVDPVPGGPGGNASAPGDPPPAGGPGDPGGAPGGNASGPGGPGGGGDPVDPGDPGDPTMAGSNNTDPDSMTLPPGVNAPTFTDPDVDSGPDADSGVIDFHTDTRKDWMLCPDDEGITFWGIINKDQCQKKKGNGTGSDMVFTLECQARPGGSGSCAYSGAPMDTSDGAEISAKIEVTGPPENCTCLARLMCNDPGDITNRNLYMTVITHCQTWSEDMCAMWFPELGLRKRFPPWAATYFALSFTAAFFGAVLLIFAWVAVPVFKA